MIPTFEADSLNIKVTVQDESTGLPLVMAGITWVAFAQRRGGASITGAVNVVTDGELSVRFTPDTFAAAVYDVQVRGAVGVEVQTLHPPIQVSVDRSLRAPA